MSFVRGREDLLRPLVDTVYSSDWTVTLSIAEKRHSLGVQVHSNSVRLPSQTIAHFTGDGAEGAKDLPHLLTEIVHQSGWQWEAAFRF